MFYKENVFVGDLNAAIMLDIWLDKVGGLGSGYGVSA